MLEPENKTVEEDKDYTRTEDVNGADVVSESNGSDLRPDVVDDAKTELNEVNGTSVLEALEVPNVPVPEPPSESPAPIEQPKDGKEKSRRRSRRRSRSRSRYRSRSAGSHSRDRRSEKEKPIPKVIHKIEYRHVSTNAVVFEEESDRFAPTKPPPEEPVLEVITIAFTAQERSPYSYRHDNKPPPIHSLGHTFIQVNSAAVINALRNVVEYYPGQNLIGDSITISEPYTILVHHEQELIQYRDMFKPGSKKDDDEPCEVEEDTFEHLSIVLDFLSKTMKDNMEKERARHAQEKPVATYEMLWSLFKPGTNVYFDAQSAGIFDSFIVKNVSWEINNGAPVRYNIGLWNLYYDSIHIGPRNHYAVVLPFDGEKEIGTLDIFPCEYLREDLHKETADAMQKRLEERGKVFFKLTSKQCMWYDGLTTTFPRQKFTGTVMVDAESFWASLQEKAGNKSPTGSPPPLISDDVGERTIGGIPTCVCKRCVKLNTSNKKSKFADYARINPMTQKELTPHQYWLCDRSVWGFIMKVRAWHRLDAANFSAPKFDTALINDLVLAPDTKSLIKSLSKKYAREAPTPTPTDTSSSDHWAADFVQGKGEGMIFLLHGKPGVGKTYTAECVAEYTRRPLLSLTCTDIGTNPLVIESKLAYWFKLAKHWGTILLIDEADIYMEQRMTRDLERNNLVAGFLRAMEYYQGILFLTTNRVGTFDDAFISRIHVSIHYPEFSEDDRKEVWSSFFRKLEAERGDKMVVGEDVKKYVTEGKEMRVVKWNGREIRNAFQTAVALAEVEDEKVSAGDERVVLKMSHINSIVKMSANFKSYLNTLHQGDETKRAAREGLRVDDFEEAVEREKKGFAHYM